MSRIAELFGISTALPLKTQEWGRIIEKSRCPFLSRQCLKNRKSNPEILIGTCTVSYGSEHRSIVICPHRLLERRQIFTDCLHLLTLHEPGNEIHVVPEIPIPGGSVDYFLASVHRRKVRDFVGIELQTLDTSGTVWPERRLEDVDCADTFGMNWKMTAKTTLVQLHHKVATFEGTNKHLVLVVQNWLIDYMRANFAFDHIKEARLGDPMHFHAYQLDRTNEEWHLQLAGRFSTDVAGVSRSLGLQADPRVEVDTILALLEERISDSTLFDLTSPISDVTPTTEPS